MGFPSEFVVQFACVFTMFLLWFVALVPVRRAQAMQEEGYNNTNPRDQYNKLPEWGKRANSAVNNTFEGLVFFSLAVFTQAFSRISREDRSEYGKVADIFCIIYIVLRAIYLPMFWFNLSAIRSLVWSLGLICVFALFVIAFI